MSNDLPVRARRRFPWVYAFAVLVPFVSIATLLVADMRYGPAVTMGPGMMMALVMMPYCV